MKIQFREVDDISIVALQGELDSQTAPDMESQILPLVHPQCKILLDMSGVSYISSIGLRALLLLYRETTGSQGRILLSGLPEMIYDTMLITGFLDFFEAYDTIEEGLSALAA
jgi:anti-sigma B factor antagonist